MNTVRTSAAMDEPVTFEGVFPEIGHSRPGDVVADLRAAADRRIEDGLLGSDERTQFVERIEQRLIEHMGSARVRHPVRLSSKGR